MIKPTAVIVTADDFGLSREVESAVERALELVLETAEELRLQAMLEPAE